MAYAVSVVGAGLGKVECRDAKKSGLDIGVQPGIYFSGSVKIAVSP